MMDSVENNNIDFIENIGNLTEVKGNLKAIGIILNEMDLSRLESEDCATVREFLSMEIINCINIVDATMDNLYIKNLECKKSPCTRQEQ